MIILLLMIIILHDILDMLDEAMHRCWPYSDRPISHRRSAVCFYHFCIYHFKISVK